MAMAAFKIIRLACIVVVLHWGVKGAITDDALESQAGDLGNSKNQDDHGLIALHNAAIRRTLCLRGGNLDLRSMRCGVWRASL
jgi:hypothetical protein